jgi:uncharacterized protein YigE (DUF2233 family)
MPLLAALACAPPAEPALPVENAAPTAGIVVTYDAIIAAGNGLELHQLGWRVAERTGVAWAARVPRDGRLTVKPSAEVRPLADLTAGEAGTWAAINGGFYEDGPMGLVVSDGVERHPLANRGGSGVVEYDPMPVGVVHRDAWKPGAKQALQSIDRLVDAGASLVKPREGAHLDARSAVAVSADGVWVVAAVANESLEPGPDGVTLVRTVGHGLALSEFADLLVTGLYAEQALNLDGAVSTQMVVSIPPWRWVVTGERGTINGVVVRGR